MACEQEQATYNAALADYNDALAAVNAIQVQLGAAQQVATNRFNDMQAAYAALIACQNGGGQGM